MKNETHAEGDESPVGRSDMLVEAGLTLSSELELSAVLQRIVDLAARITGARYGALGVLDEAARITDFVTTGVAPEQREAIGDPPTGRGILGVVTESGRPVRIPKIEADPRSVGFPAHHPPMASFLGAPLVSRGHVFGSIYLTDKRDGEEFDEEDERALVVLATQAGVAVENARLYEETRARERRLEAVAGITAAILAGAGSDEALELVAQRARELVDADLATIATAADGGKLVFQIADGARADEIRYLEFSPEGSVPGQVIQSGRALVLDDILDESSGVQPAAELQDIGPVMLVPLSSRGRTFGTLGVYNIRGGRTFDEDDLRLVETFADQAAVALEYSRAQREMHRLAVMEDRERIAKELHDGVIQALFAVGMGLQGTAALAKDEQIEYRIEAAADELDHVVRDLRNYIFGLRPGILADRQLDQALRHLAQDFEDKTSVVAVVDVNPDVAAELSPRAADVIQMTREALSNIGRHADATTCRVSLRRDDTFAMLEIDDDGKGFDPTAGRGGGQGLSNLRQRAAALGGEMEISSSPAEGTTIQISIPLT